MSYSCCDTLRRDLVAASPTLNGIDYLEVIDSDLPSGDPLRQQTLLLHCLKPLPAGFSQANVRISGGERITNVGVVWAAVATPVPAQFSMTGEAATAAIVGAEPAPATILVVRTTTSGDFSTYTLTLVASALDASPPAGFDPRLSSVDFCFKVDCPSDFDCQPNPSCPPEISTPPAINYLAKDFTTFTTLMSDRMSQLVPDWQQGSLADYGMALIELLAYAGDQLSYQQDAIATEAYLETARRRISLRRLAVLVDYAMHDGCNARAWVQIQISQPQFTLTAGKTQFLTRCAGFPAGLPIGSRLLADAMLTGPLIFEPLETPTLYQAHNKISFYTWSDKNCCLPAGSTAATLAGTYPNLTAGDTLLFEEVMGPRTGAAGDADPAHRQVVRLTSVLPIAPAVLTDPLTGAAITQIAWAQADALTFPLCVSSTTDAAHGGKALIDVSVARGNIVLIDHGQTVSGESLGQMPDSTLFLAPAGHPTPCTAAAPVPVPARYNPTLALAPLTQQARVQVASGTPGSTATVSKAFDPSAAATDAMNWSPDEAIPSLTLTGTLNGTPAVWRAQRSLLESGAGATDFVAEVDDNGAAHLRFGDNEHGMRPLAGTAFTATYRVGNGSAGNAGAETIVHMVASAGDLANIANLRNPLAAEGGVDMETADSVRRNAPQAFRTQERAVTPADYAVIAERRTGVLQAAADLRWSGSWYTAFITVDPDDGVAPGPLKTALKPFVDTYRMAGHDLEFNDPIYVSLEIEMHICVQPDYFRSDVETGLLAALGNKRLPNGRTGLFYPDNFGFGQTVYLSPIYAAAHAVPGVQSVLITTFQRQGTPDPSYLINGELPLAPLEIARLDNDRNFPEHGVLRLDLNGGK
nr:putative baseplate assembly protein [uncultured Rhodopila sp.]